MVGRAAPFFFLEEFCERIQLPRVYTPRGCCKTICQKPSKEIPLHEASRIYRYDRGRFGCRGVRVGVASGAQIESGGRATLYRAQRDEERLRRNSRESGADRLQGSGVCWIFRSFAEGHQGAAGQERAHVTVVSCGIRGGAEQVGGTDRCGSRDRT